MPAGAAAEVLNAIRSSPQPVSVESLADYSVLRVTCPRCGGLDWGRGDFVLTPSGARWTCGTCRHDLQDGTVSRAFLRIERQQEAAP